MSTQPHTPTSHRAETGTGMLVLLLVVSVLTVAGMFMMGV